jgi:thioredoxin reductase
MDNFKKHAEISGSEILQETVEIVDKFEDYFLVKTVT